MQLFYVYNSEGGAEVVEGVGVAVLVGGLLVEFLDVLIHLGLVDAQLLFELCDFCIFFVDVSLDIGSHGASRKCGLSILLNHANLPFEILVLSVCSGILLVHDDDSSCQNLEFLGLL